MKTSTKHTVIRYLKWAGINLPFALLLVYAISTRSEIATTAVGIATGVLLLIAFTLFAGTTLALFCLRAEGMAESHMNVYIKSHQVLAKIASHKTVSDTLDRAFDLAIIYTMYSHELIVIAYLYFVHFAFLEGIRFYKRHYTNYICKNCDSVITTLQGALNELEDELARRGHE